MNTAHFKKNRARSFLAVSQIVVLLLCVACGKEPDPVAAPASAPDAAASAPQSTGLVKHPVKLSDTADALKWMDMASAKSPAQIAKEEKIAKDANDAKIAAEAKQIHDAKLATDAKTAANVALVADAKTAADARTLAAAKAVENQKAAAAAQAQLAAAPKAAPAVQEPTLKVLSSVQPKFPKSAALDGVTSGLVTAKLHIEVDGRVSKVDILTAAPKQYFDRAVIAAALQWKYAPMSKPMNTTMEFSFKMDGDGT